MPRVQQKRGTAANLTAVDPTPLAGELLVVTDENTLVIGNGTDAYTSLAYVTATPRSHTHPLSEISDLNIKSPGSPMLPYDVALSYNYVTGTWATKEIGLVGVGGEPAGGWPTGSLGAALADLSTPTAHKSTHAMSGSDPLFWYDIGASSATHAAEHAVGGSDVLTPAAIGAAPAASPTFTGVITVSATSGSAGSYAPSVTFSGDSNTGFGQVSGQSDTVSIFTAGSERVRVDASGRVGIGYATPADFNQVVSAPHAVIGNGSSASGVTIYSGTGVSGSLAFADGTTTTDQYRGLLAYTHSVDAMRFFTSATERVRIDSSGNVGIGTTSPASRLDVNGVITVSAGSAVAPALVTSGDANTGAFFPAADTFAISTAGVERLRVDASGRVGIGTGITAMLANADDLVIGNGTSEPGMTFHGSTTSRGTIAFADGSTGTDSYSGYIQYGHTNNDLRVATNATVRMLIDGSGNVGVGTTSPSTLLDINSDKIRLRTAKTPASASDTGNAGDICWDASYLYICTATNTWRRIAHSTW